MTKILQESPDALYTTAAIGRWSAIEIDVGIMCSCLMLLPAFINHHTPERWREYLSHRICQLSGSGSETKHYAECSWPKGRFRELDGERGLAKSRTEESIHSLQPSVELADKGKLLSQSRAYWGRTAASFIRYIYLGTHSCFFFFIWIREQSYENDH